MLFISKGGQMEDEEFRPCIEYGVARYVVSGFDVEDLACMNTGDLGPLNELCTDKVVDNGHLLMDINYKFFSVDQSDNTAAILVEADASEWLANLQI
jgi:hypothetical protein